MVKAANPGNPGFILAETYMSCCWHEEERLADGNLLLKKSQALQLAVSCTVN